VSRITAIFKAITRNWLRSRSGLFFSFLFPVMFLLVFGSVFGNTNASGYTLSSRTKDACPRLSDLPLTEFHRRPQLNEVVAVNSRSWRLPSTSPPSLRVTPASSAATRESL